MKNTNAQEELLIESQEELLRVMLIGKYFFWATHADLLVTRDEIEESIDKLLGSGLLLRDITISDIDNTLLSIRRSCARALANEVHHHYALP